MPEDDGEGQRHTNPSFRTEICRGEDSNAEILLDFSDEFECVVVLEMAVL